MVFILYSLISAIYAAFKTLKPLAYVFLLMFYDNKDIRQVYHQRKMLKLSLQGVQGLTGMCPTGQV